MEKIVYTNTMPYSYDPMHAGAHYLIGGRYKNHGEFCESVAKFHRHMDYIVNPSTSYSNGSDIPSLMASVKSSESSLADIFADDKLTILRIYFSNVHSTKWIWVSIVDDEVVEYHMDKDEFQEFAFKFTTMNRKSGTQLMKLRFRKESHKMLMWLEEKLQE